MTTTDVSMAAKSSDLDDQLSGANLQIKGHVPILPSGQKGLEETRASGNAPSNSPSQSPERQPSPGHPEIQ